MGKKEVTLAKVPLLNVTQAHAITSEDAPNWKRVTFAQINKGDHVIVVYYQDNSGGVFTPSSIYLMK
jgi:hypothetical protein